MNKKVIFSFFVILIISNTAAASFIQADAQSYVDTSAFISVSPNPALYNQDTVYVSIQITPPPPTPNEKFKRIAVTVTRPDGIVATNYYDSNTDGTLQFSTYSNPSMVGNWLFKVNFSGQAFANNTIVYLPSENQTIFTRLPAPPPPWSAVGNWTTRASMPNARGNLGAAVVNDKIYAIGGDIQSGQRIWTGGFIGPTTGGVVDANEEYDPATNKWTDKTSMPTPRANFGIATFQNKIYCIGGRTMLDNINNGLTGVNEVYDPATNTWTTKAPMPTPRSWVQANVVDGKIYLTGGYPNETLNEVYDPETDSWTTKASMPLGPGYPNFYASTVFDNKIYVISGSLQIYDPNTSKWSLGTSPPSSLSGTTAATATIGKLAAKRIYVIGVPSDYKPSNHIYSPENDTWTFGADMPTLRENFAVAVVNDTLYVIGGHTFNIAVIQTYAPTNMNEQYIPNGYGTPDQNYRPPTATPSPSLSSSPTPSTLPTPTSPTLTPSPSESPSVSAMPSASQQPTPPPEITPTFPTEYIYTTVVIAVIAIIAATAIILKRKK